MSKLYFVDGYHGGIRGHMPEGSWQDILYAMERWHDWHISLEIEPESWEYLRQHDLHTYRRMQKLISDTSTSDRVEFISGSYAQPFCWAVNGESNIRQLIHGIEVINRHFPTAEIDTYAVQEPCFTSSLPQILTKLGFKRMSLKNPTAWGGYMAKMPGEIVHLKSGDGSTIPTVPRYECEELISCNATEASGYDYTGIVGFAEKCVDNGIVAPIGMCLQDSGWSSAPLVQGIDVEYTTFRKYFKQFGSRVNGVVDFSQEDICVALPWGNRIFQEMLQTVRRAENRILQTEKLLAIAETEKATNKDSLSVCHTLLNAAWEMLMQAQHHDGYICATCGDGVKQWAFRSNKLALDCCALLDKVTSAAQESISGAAQADTEKEAEIWLRVCNTVGNPYKSQAEVVLGLEPGVRSLKVYDAQGDEVQCQYSVEREYADGGIGTALLRFEVRSDGLGYSTYRVVPSDDCSPKQTGIARNGIQNTVEVKTDRLHLVFDKTKGGCLVRLLDLSTGRDYAAGVTGMGSLKGYLIQEHTFVSTLNSQAECEFLENGPLCCRLRFSGTFNGIAFWNTVTVRSGDPRIDFETTARFAEKTELGFPYEPTEQERYLGTKRSSCREDFKLGVQIPLGFEAIKTTKSAPFDVYESALTDTRFDSWETIKHNILNGYADLYQEGSNSGIAVFCNGVNGYSLVDNVFSLTLAFGYHSNFWWGYQPAEGKYSITYSLFPHNGNWEQAGIAFEDAKLREPLVVQRLPQSPACASRCLIGCTNLAVETVTILPSENGHQLRLFHAGSDESPLELTGEMAENIVSIADLWGNKTNMIEKTIGKLEIKTLICE